ncbi:MAG TPA: twin-arginine translocase TatA/TatE family subunit [Phycisphaerae bacterium]|nr:twin-arginine translocase TatA/TatE family subunit [Phycisphaerae bacterium]HNU44401.1 twin-arginine translocase TatA/TatE family subunit [Phycisphaerae bacterium]
MRILALFGMPGGMEWIVILAVALLIFGRRLPDVMRNVGRSIVEFKRGIRDVKDDIDYQSRLEAPKPGALNSKAEASAPPPAAPHPAPPAAERPAEHAG